MSALHPRTGLGSRGCDDRARLPPATRSRPDRWRASRFRAAAPDDEVIRSLALAGAERGVSVARDPLIVVGASARAAAFSAARAGFEPYWLDRYGDRDLAAAAPGQILPPDWFDRHAWPPGVPVAPWLYGAPLENAFDLLHALAAERALLGNDAACCRAVRDPAFVADCLAGAGLEHAPVITDGRAPGRGDVWLRKPRLGSGGCGIVEHPPGSAFDPARVYLQRRVNGEAVAAVFMGNGRDAVLCGVTAQLIGEPALHAGPWVYCGSIGPLQPDAAEYRAWEAIGRALARGFALRGLFGVDAIRTPRGPCAVEVNPRYTAAVEVIEQASARALLALHRDACRGGALPRLAPYPVTRVAGKAYVFAPVALRIPASTRFPGEGGCADLPRAGTAVGAGQPLVSVFAQGDTLQRCRAALLDRAARVLARCRPAQRRPP